MDELQNLIMNSVKNPSYFKQINIKDLIDDENIKDELLNILQIIVTNNTKQTNQLKNYMDDINIKLENKINNTNDYIKELDEKLIKYNISLNSYINLIESNKVIDNLQSNSIKLSILEKDFRMAINKYDKIYLDNIFIPNLISPKGTKFKNIKELLSNNYDEICRIKSVIEKYNKDLEMIKSNQNNKSFYLIIKKMQDIVEQKLELFENNIKAYVNEYMNNKDKIDKNNELKFEELQKKNEEFNQNLNNTKKKIEDNFNEKLLDQHILIDNQIININQLKEFNKEYTKMNEKLEKDLENQKILIQKYIRYFELYKYRENFFLQKEFQKDSSNKEKSKGKIKKLKEKKKNIKLSKVEYGNKMNNKGRIQNHISFNESFNNDKKMINNIQETISDNEINLFNFIKNNSFDFNNFNNNLFFYNLFNTKSKDNKDINIINPDEYLRVNSDIIYNKNKEEKKVSHTDNNLELNTLPNINNIINDENNLKNKDNNINLEINLIKSIELNEESNKIKFKKANLFNSHNLKQLTVNKSNNNISDYPNLKDDNNVIKDENNKVDLYESNHLQIKKNNNFNETLSYATIDNYMDNKLNNDAKNGLKKTSNKEIKKTDINRNIKFEKNKKIEEIKEEERKIFKLNVLKFDSFDSSNKINEIKNIHKENKPNKAINMKILSKSLPFKKERNKTNKNYVFSADDYVKIIQKNKIKRVNTAKKLNISKKVN